MPVRVIRLASESTVDERIIALAADKARRTRDIIGGTSNDTEVVEAGSATEESGVSRMGGMLRDALAAEAAQSLASASAGGEAKREVWSDGGDAASSQAEQHEEVDPRRVVWDGCPSRKRLCLSIHVYPLLQ